MMKGIKKMMTIYWSNLNLKNNWFIHVITFLFSEIKLLNEITASYHKAMMAERLNKFAGLGSENWEGIKCWSKLYFSRY